MAAVINIMCGSIIITVYAAVNISFKMVAEIYKTKAVHKAIVNIILILMGKILFLLSISKNLHSIQK